MPKYIIDAVIRSLDIFDAFLNSGESQLRLAQLSSKTGVNKNAVFRSLYTLVQAGFLEKEEKSGTYRLSLKMVELGRLARQGEGLRQLVLPTMDELWTEFQETVNLGMLRNKELILVEVRECPHPLRLIESPGLVQPLHATALGKAVLSTMNEQERRQIVTFRGLKKYTDKTITEWSKLRRELEETRIRGWAIDDEENTLGARCIASPLISKGRAVGAISISGPTSRMTLERVQEMTKVLTGKCASLSRLV